MRRLAILFLTISATMMAASGAKADPVTGTIGSWLWGNSIGDYKGPCPPPRPPILDDPSRPFEDSAREKARQEYMNAVITCRTDKPPTPGEICSRGKPPSGLGPECENYCKFCAGTRPFTTNPINGSDPDDPMGPLNTGVNLGNQVGTVVSTGLLAIKLMEEACSKAGGACISGPFRDAINCMKGIVNNMTDLANAFHGPMSSEEAANAVCNLIQSMNTCRDMAMNPGLQGQGGGGGVVGAVGGAIVGAFRDPLAGGATACMIAQTAAKKIKCESWKNACDDASWGAQPILPMRGGGGYGAEGESACSPNDPLSSVLTQCGGSGQ